MKKRILMNVSINSSKASSQIVDIKSLFKDENKEIKTNE